MKIVKNNQEPSKDTVSIAVIFFMVFWLAAPLMGQSSPKKDLQVSDFSLWYKINPLELSTNGNWVSFVKLYKHQNDTVIVKNTNDETQYLIPAATSGRFSENSKWYAALNKEAILKLIKLEETSEVNIKNVRSHSFSKDGRFLGYIQSGLNDNPNSQVFTLKDLDGNRKYVFNDIKDFVFDTKSNSVLLYRHTPAVREIKLISLINPKDKIVLHRSEIGEYTSYVFSKDGSSVAFMESMAVMDSTKPVNYKAHWIRDIKDPKNSSTFNPLENDILEHPVWVKQDFFFKMRIADDHQKLFFHIDFEQIELKENENESSSVEVWNAADRFTYPSYQRIKKNVINPNILVAWWPDKNKLVKLGNKTYSKSLLSPNQKYVFTYSEIDYRPHFVYNDELTDTFIYDTETGESKEFIKKKKLNNCMVHFSPSGKYVSYFHKNNWWVYDSEINTHTQISENNNQFAKQFEYSFLKHHVGRKPAWSVNEEEFIYYDSHDIWASKPNGSNKRRLTFGKENGITFRIYDLAFTHLENNIENISYSEEYDLKKGVFLKAVDEDEKSGFFYLDNKGTQQIVFKNAYIPWLKKAKNTNTVVYTEERFDLPRSIVKTSLLREVKNRLVYQSNPHHFKYNWGKSELLKYNDNEGNQLKGALFFPANFNPNKKYAVIVHFYEIMSDKLHHYQTPTLYNPIDNYSNFTSDEYFVFFPDIKQDTVGPGLSALNSINAGLDELIKRPYINSQKLGLTGHSLGGYRTAFIVTLSDRFATAIAGSAATNLLSKYLSYAWLWSRPQTWRFERQQLGFGISYFENPYLYISNSPIHHVHNINTPILTWTGDQDSNVNWNQSIELYNALRRLEKEHVFLLYRKEGHSLLKKENQVDLSIRTKQWFDYYLKDKPPAKWITNKN